MNNHLYFKQLEIGPMQNYVYLIGSSETRKIAVVDAAWEIDTILKIAKQDEMEITHAFVTHTHPDHVYGLPALVQNLIILGRRAPLPVYCRVEHVDRLRALLQLFDLENQLFKLLWHAGASFS